jgi:signal transduction histidine kinase
LDHPEEKERMEHEYAEAAKQYNIDESVRRCEGMFREAIEEMKQHRRDLRRVEEAVTCRDAP